MHSLTNFPSITPDSAITLFLVKIKFFNTLFGVITTPLNPLSETNKFEPDPIKYVGISFLSQKVKILLISSISLGIINALAGPPIP